MVIKQRGAGTSKHVPANAGKNAYNPERRTIYHLGTADEDTALAAEKRGFNSVSIAERGDTSGDEDKFTVNIVVSKEAARNAAEIAKALSEHNLEPRDGDAMLGFTDWDIATAYKLSAMYPGTTPYRRADGFMPLDKIAQRRALEAAGIKQVRWSPVVLSRASLEKAAKRVGFPAILKPSSSYYTLGVILVKNHRQLYEAAERLQKWQKKSRGARFGSDFTGFLLEEYVAGKEVNVQGVVRKGKVRIDGICSKIITECSDGTFVESGHIAYKPNPSLPVHQALIRATKRDIAAIGYQEGTFNSDYRGDRLLELNYRTAGSRHAVDAITGFRQEDETYASVLGEPPLVSKAAGFVRVRKDELALAKRLCRDEPSIRIHKIIPMSPHKEEIAKITLTGPDPQQIRRILRKITKSRSRVPPVQPDMPQREQRHAIPTTLAPSADNSMVKPHPVRNRSAPQARNGR